MVVATLQLLYRVFNGCGKRHSYRKFIDAHACAFLCPCFPCVAKWFINH